MSVEIIKMPRLSDTMEEGTVDKWHKKIGDEVKEGDLLADIQTDKATMEFEAFQSGFLLHIGVEEGKVAKVDSLLAILGNKDEDITDILKNIGTNVTESKKEEVKEEKKEVVVQQEEPKELPKPKESNKNFVSEHRVKASPLAKKVAREKGIDITAIKGTGEDGRIVKKDVEFYNPEKGDVASVFSFERHEESTREEVNTPMRKVIAKRLSQSKFTAPHYYLSLEVNMDNLASIRKDINDNKENIKISFNDIIIKGVAHAIRKNPQINTIWKEDKTIYNNHINIGVAVAIDEGLVVPVVRFVDTKGISQISDEVKVLAKKAKDKKLHANEMSGSTFTISNLGMYGIESFTSIINQPESCILSVGAIIQKPIVKNGQIVIGNMMKLTLACDHRTVDGSVGARFLNTLKEYLENPVKILL